MSGYGIFDILILLCGIYLIYAALYMKKTGTINATVALGKNVDENRIKDRAAYINYIVPRLVILGVICVVASGLNLLVEQFGGPSIITMVSCLLFIIALVFYGVSFKKAQNKFFY